jgi:probable HAF family extracellular repeat protein
MIDLGTLGGDFVRCYARGINSRGDVVGHCSTDTEMHAFFWTKRHGMIDLGTLGGKSSEAFAINDRRQVVGWSYTTAKGDSHAVLWTIR